MKKTLCLLLAAGFMAACNNDGTTKTNAADSNNSPNYTNVQNVNGNQPDTLQGNQLTTSQSGDTTKKNDSLPR